MSKKEIKTKERKQAEKILQTIEKEQVSAIVKASTEGEDLPTFTDKDINKRFLELSEKKKVKTEEVKKVYFTEVFAMEYLTDWINVALALICFVASFFVPKFQIGWIFSIAILGLLVIRHPIAKLIPTIFTFSYFVGVMTSGYYLTSEQIWSAMFGLNTIFKWGFFFASLLMFLVFIISVVGGAKKLAKRGLVLTTIGLMGMSLVMSFIDLEYHVTNLIYSPYVFFPYTNITNIFVINSAGFFLTLCIAWGFWYLIAWVFRRLVVSKKILEVKEA